MPDALGRMTNYDYAATLLDLSHLPEFEFSETGERRPLPKRPRLFGPAIPAGLLQLPRTPGNRVTRIRSTVELDPDWSIRFTTKFSKVPDPDAPLLRVRGAGEVLKDFTDPIEELNYLTETQHLELASTKDELAANGMQAGPLTEADMNVEHGVVAAYVVRIADEMMKDEDGHDICVPRYASMYYAAQLVRRIEWERARYQNGELERTKFARTDTPSGVGIFYYGKDKDPDVIKEHLRTHKYLWLDKFGALPTPDELPPRWRKGDAPLPSIEHRLTKAQRDEYLESKFYGDYDDDPWRAALHADPDPKPTRDQYPFGDHRHCFTRKAETIHRGCSDDGWQRFKEDRDWWVERERKHGREPYAGPSGIPQLDLDAIPDNEGFE